MEGLDESRQSSQGFRLTGAGDVLLRRRLRQCNPSDIQVQSKPSEKPENNKPAEQHWQPNPVVHLEFNYLADVMPAVCKSASSNTKVTFEGKFGLQVARCWELGVALTHEIAECLDKPIKQTFAWLQNAALRGYVAKTPCKFKVVGKGTESYGWRITSQGIKWMALQWESTKVKPHGAD